MKKKIALLEIFYFLKVVLIIMNLVSLIYLLIFQMLKIKIEQLELTNNELIKLIFIVFI